VTYTQLCAVAVPVALVLDLAVLRTALVRRRVFWVAYAIIGFFQLLTNGWLTGRGIVTYDGKVIIGDSQAQFLGAGRLIFAPIEDIAFGFSLVLQTLSWWVFWGRYDRQRAASRRADTARTNAGSATAARRRPGTTTRPEKMS
jgi:lycopene cyclase domain-containing protein